MSTLLALGYLAAMVFLDRRRLRGLATAFVLPGVLALITGVEALGDASSHAWAGGLLALGAGTTFGLLGEWNGRRFTAWTGGTFASFGMLVVALDAAHISNAINFETRNVKLVGPGLLVMLFGTLLLGVAYAVTRVRSERERALAGESVSTPNFQQ